MENDIVFLQLYKKFHLTMKHVIKKCNTFGITDQEFVILMTIHNLSEETEVTASLLAAKFDVTLPAIMHRLSTLEEKLLIKKIKSSVDKRVKSFVLVDDVVDKVKNAKEKKKKCFDEIINYLGEDNMDNLKMILDKTTKFLEEEYD